MNLFFYLKILTKIKSHLSLLYLLNAGTLSPTFSSVPLVLQAASAAPLQSKRPKRVNTDFFWCATRKHHHSPWNVAPSDSDSASEKQQGLDLRRHNAPCKSAAASTQMSLKIVKDPYFSQSSSTSHQFDFTYYDIFGISAHKDLCQAS